VPPHIEQAMAAARELGLDLASAAAGDARNLDLGEGSVDVVLMRVLLYHLQERSERYRALKERSSSGAA
jgi:ubiquinone/menaquinone biosynthesis C-methylase UbiE